jgi:hypothetical protein
MKRLLCAVAAIGLVSITVDAAYAGTAARSQEQQAPSLTPESAVVDYCAAWNTSDRDARDRLLSRVWSTDGVYSDPDPTLAAGRRALSNTIADFQRHHPGTRFRCSAPQTHHGVMRATWILLRADGKQLAQGMDFYDLAPDGRIRRVAGFFGAPPAVAP